MDACIGREQPLPGNLKPHAGYLRLPPRLTTVPPPDPFPSRPTPPSTRGRRMRSERAPRWALWWPLAPGPKSKVCHGRVVRPASANRAAADADALLIKATPAAAPAVIPAAGKPAEARRTRSRPGDARNARSASREQLPRDDDDAPGGASSARGTVNDPPTPAADAADA